jgi:hypothetical protein
LFKFCAITCGHWRILFKFCAITCGPWRKSLSKFRHFRK